HPGEWIARWHLHLQQPVELPAALFDQVCLGDYAPTRGARVAPQQAQQVEQLPQRDTAADHVFAVVARVVPSAGHVEYARRPPAGIQLSGVRAGPTWNCGITAVR